MGKYKEIREYLFNVGGETWAITDIFRDLRDRSCIGIKETRCNGQEDSHMSGEFVFVDGKWMESDAPCSSNIARYSDQNTVDAIVAFLNENNPMNETWWYNGTTCSDECDDEEEEDL